MTSFGMPFHDNDAQLVQVATLLPPAKRTQALAHMRWCAHTPYATLKLMEVNNG